MAYDRHILGRNGRAQVLADRVLTSMVRRLEAATSRLEDIASSTFPDADKDAAGLNGTPAVAAGSAQVAGASAGSTPKASVVAPSAPPAIEAFDELVNTELEKWLELGGMLGDVIGGQSKAVQQAFAAERQFLVIADKAKKPDDRTIMELLKDLQANIEKTDEFRQRNREAALKDPLTLVADGVGSLGWVAIGVGGPTKPHDHINEMFGGAQIAGNKVLKEYRDKYAPRLFVSLQLLTWPGLRTRSLSSGFRHTTSCSRLFPNTQRNTIPTV